MKKGNQQIYQTLFLKNREKQPVLYQTLFGGNSTFLKSIRVSATIRYLRKLSIKDGYEAQVVFMIQMRGVRCFAPNDKTHPAFGAALSAAADSGVKVIALDCDVSEKHMAIKGFVPVRLCENEMAQKCVQIG